MFINYKNEYLKRLTPQHFKAYTSPHRHKNVSPYISTFKNFGIDTDIDK